MAHTPLFRAGGWRTTMAMSAVGVAYFFPVLWMILMAFKSRQDALATPPKLLFHPTLEHYWSLFNRVTADGKQVFASGFERYVLNSLGISSVSVLLAMLIGGLAAYGFVRMRVKGSGYFLFYILTLRMMPPLVSIIPLYLIFSRIGLGGSYTGIILVYTAFNLPFAIWMLRSFLLDLHRPVEDAAWLDGSPRLTIIRRICVPQMLPGIAATAIIGFLFTWNDFLFSLMLTGSDTRTLSVAMATVMGADFGTDWGIFAAIGTIYLLPVLLIAFFLQKQLLRGATFGTIAR